MIWFKVNQEGRTPTRCCPTTTTPLTAIMPDTMACLRTLLARGNRSWWRRKVKSCLCRVQAQTFGISLCRCQWNATAKVKHQTRADEAHSVCRHKSDTTFTFGFLWMGSSVKTNIWYVVTIRKQEEDCMSSSYSLFSKDGNIFILENFYVSVTPFTVYPTKVFFLFWNTLDHRKTCYTVCNYLMRWYYLYVIYCTQDENTVVGNL